MTYLLDVNVLISLLDVGHVHSGRARSWFRSVGMDDWATCPITELGAVRILSNPAYGGVLDSMPAIVDKLEALKGYGRHAFWPDALSLHDPRWFRRDRLLVYKQLTDSYLLALATSRGGKLATLDRKLVTDGVIGGAQALAYV
jgi:hypothetical protein